VNHEPCVIGIDPGFSGGLVALALDAVPVASVAMPQVKARKGNDLDTRAILEWLDWIGHGFVNLVVMERPGPRPTDGSVQAFKFGWMSGKLCGLIEGQALPMELVTPQSWQKAILPGVVPGHATDTKARSIAYVKRRWPGLNLRRTDRCKVDHDGIADAACIAEWARRRIVGAAAEAGASPRPRPSLKVNGEVEA
jgi:hypothetical protein